MFCVNSDSVEVLKLQQYVRFENPLLRHLEVVSRMTTWQAAAQMKTFATRNRGKILKTPKNLTHSNFNDVCCHIICCQW